MADIFSGYKRSLKCYVSKKLNGVIDVGYPKQYPTATDIANGYFTYNSVQYDIPTSEEISTMSQSAYDSLLAIFKLYVEAAESGASFATDTIVQPTIYDPSGCAVDIPTTTTSTTTTTIAIDPTETYAMTSDGDGYISSQTVFQVDGATAGDIITVRFGYTGTLELDLGYLGTQAKVYASYPDGTTQALGTCFSDSSYHNFNIEKNVSFIATAQVFTITTEAYKINSSNEAGHFTCSITNIQRDSIDYPMSLIVYGKHYKSMESQFSC